MDATIDIYIKRWYCINIKFVKYSLIQKTLKTSDEGQLTWDLNNFKRSYTSYER